MSNKIIDPGKVERKTFPESAYSNAGDRRCVAYSLYTVNRTYPITSSNKGSEPSEPPLNPELQRLLVQRARRDYEREDELHDNSFCCIVQ
ncbi:MAG: hypothetical protein ABS68_13350 [Niastella sp. SCN 39-18]|nr:MAG: hypothetical protein ABS68_13350 [Niastella sp. SCN 39-18]